MTDEQPTDSKPIAPGGAAPSFSRSTSPQAKPTHNAAATAIGSWATFGIFLLLVGGLVIGLAYGAYVDSKAYDPILEEMGEPSDGAMAGVIIGSLATLIGTLMTSVAVVAKGVQIGRLASK